MKVQIKISLLVADFVFYSCEGEKENPSNTSRTLRYELTGNYSGTTIASYTTANGGKSQVSSTKVVANSIGSFTIAAPVITF